MHLLHFSLLSPSSPRSSPLSLARVSLPNPSAVTYPLFPAYHFRPFALVCSSRALAPLSISREPAAAESVAGTGDDEREEMKKYREVGVISTTHGVRGEVKVVPSTDFPEIRFGKPGKRWLRTRDGGKELIKEIQLTKGRSNPGQKSWIISFRGINSVEEANNIIGSTLLVRSDDRPELQEGEFYTPDLVGMRVILKETGKTVGTVTNVMNTKGNDLLQVKPDTIGGEEEEDSSDSQILIPFVEEIVTEVDVERREMHIIPPKGLLELNTRSSVGSKKERRVMEWKQKKKSQQRLATAKKILNEMEQSHVLDALKLANKTQKASLAKQIASIDFRLFQHAMKNFNEQINGMSEDMDKNFSLLLKNAMRISHESLLGNESERNKFHDELREKGSELLSNSKAAIVLIRSEKNKVENNSEIDADLKNFLSAIGELLEGKDSTPFVMVTAAREVKALQEYLRDNDYFGLDHQKVWVLEEGRLPIFRMPVDQSSSKILFKSPFELLEAPMGSGGFLSQLSSQKIFDAFNQMGIEYVQVCSLDDKSSIGNPLFFGYVSSLDADVGIKLYDGNKGDETCFDMIISMKHINKISRDAKKLGFYAVNEKHIYVEKTLDRWVDVNPEVANSCRLHFPVYGLLNACSLDDICVINVLK